MQTELNLGKRKPFQMVGNRGRPINNSYFNCMSFVIANTMLFIVGLTFIVIGAICKNRGPMIIYNAGLGLDTAKLDANGIEQAENRGLQLNVLLDVNRALNIVGAWMICFGVVAIICCIIGVCGASGGSRFLLYVYATVVAMIFGGEFLCFLLFATGAFTPNIRDRLFLTLDKFATEDTPTAFFNTLQNQYGCCGIDGGDDYKKSNGWMAYQKEQLTHHAVVPKVPESCCHTRGIYPDIQALDDKCIASPTDTNSFIDVGCFDRMLSSGFNRYFNGLIVLAFLTMLVEIGCILTAHQAVGEVTRQTDMTLDGTNKGDIY